MHQRHYRYCALLMNEERSRKWRLVPAEIEESVNLAEESLAAAGKNPRKSPKWFKRAEIETRDLVRKLEGFQQQMSFADRHVLERARTTVQPVHDQLLMGLMDGTRK